MKILHNPRCRKSRESLAFLREAGIEPEIILYLEKPPSKKELKDILKKLDLSAENLVRKGEQIYKEKFKGKSLTENQWIDAMVTYPKLIERPIVIKGKKAAIGRPLEHVKALL